MNLTPPIKLIKKNSSQAKKTLSSHENSSTDISVISFCNYYSHDRTPNVHVEQQQQNYPEPHLKKTERGKAMSFTSKCFF